MTDMSISDIGMIDWANHLEIKGDIFTGYWYSTVTNWRDPQNKEIRIIKEVLLAIKCFMLKLLSGSNKFEEDNERSFPLLEASTAPKKPTHNVRCWTTILDEVIAVVPKKRATTSNTGRLIKRAMIIFVK